MIVAWVDGEPIRRDEADAELREGYRAPGGHALPAPGTAEGRQLRRWVVQVLAVRSVLAHEADRRGLTASGSRPATDRVDRVDRVALGSVAAAALAGSPYAAAVFDAVTRGIAVSAADVDACRAANPELAGEEQRLVRHTRDGRPVNGGRPYLVRRDDLHGDLVFAARLGTVVVAGPDRLAVLDVTNTAGPDLAATLLKATRSRVFARWLDVQLRDRVVLAPGFEHPGDPAQPDHTHRH